MRHLPISLDLRGKPIAIVGSGEAALAKLRLLLKTEATISVFGAEPSAALTGLAKAHSVRHVPRTPNLDDLSGSCLVYAATGDHREDARTVELGRAVGALCNRVDHLEGSDFLTPAIVDRSPLTVAVGTEGTAPVLARMIKADVEASLSPSLGVLARIAERFRTEAAALPSGGIRRSFWQRFFKEEGLRALEAGGEDQAEAALRTLANEVQAQPRAAGHVYLIGAGPGDPELLTLKARRLLDEADVVIYDRLVSAGVLELARREARFICVGKTPGGPSWRQEDINSLMVEHAANGAQIARLKSGDPSIYGRLDEELEVLDEAEVAYTIVPGVTSATAAAAAAQVSLTRRGRNSALRLLTGHDVDGFAEHDWRSLTQPGATAAIYMGVAAAKFLQGRLLMHGADPATPMSVVANASGPNQTVLSAHLGGLTQRMAAVEMDGPAIIFLGLSPRHAAPLVALPLPDIATTTLAGGT
jgi:uroporphyrin-III C-methyltransferase/precorrin-2 dehydrogenase/sirohydrochlorin ferrochelatase